MEQIDSLISEGEKVKVSCYTINHSRSGGYLYGEDFDKWLFSCNLFINQHCNDDKIKKQIEEIIKVADIDTNQTYNKIMGCLKALKASDSIKISDGNDLNKNRKIFISHCSKNKIITHKFVELLKSIGINNNQLYYSSYEENGADYLENCLDSIKNEFEKNQLIVIFMISREFYNSNVCLAEMGATWVMNEKYIPIILPPLGYSDIKGVVDPMQNSIMMLDADIDTKLDKLKDTLEKFISIEKKIELSEWTRKKKTFIEDMEKYALNISKIDNYIGDIKIIDNKVVIRIELNNNTDKRYEFEGLSVLLKLKNGTEIDKEIDDWTIKSIVLRPFEKINFYINFDNDNNIKASAVDINNSKLDVEFFEAK